MENVRGSLEISNKLNSAEKYKLEMVFGEAYMENFKLIRRRFCSLEKESAERDFSFWIKESITSYVKDYRTNKLYRLNSIYRATFKSDNYELITYEEIDNDYIEDIKKKEFYKKPIVEIFNDLGDVIANTKLFSVIDGEEYQEKIYSSYFIYKDDFDE